MADYLIDNLLVPPWWWVYALFIHEARVKGQEIIHGFCYTLLTRYECSPYVSLPPPPPPLSNSQLSSNLIQHWVLNQDD